MPQMRIFWHVLAPQFAYHERHLNHIAHPAMSPEIYLDSNATSPVLPAAIAAAADAMGTCYGNPSSTHITGLRARALLDTVRERARRVLGAGSGRVIFNSGATEGIQTAVLSALCAVRERQAAGDTGADLLLYGQTEHKAVPEALAHWNRVLGTGLILKALPVDADGRHRLDILRQLAPRAAMICTMAANNETGAITDLAAIGNALQLTASRAFWMVDSVQALGKLPLDLAGTRIDYAPFSGHKLYAPKGIGMLYVRDGAPYTPLMAGGGQEGGQRSGTENMSGIAALGAVLAALEAGKVFRTPAQLHALRDRLVASLRDALPGIVFNTPLEASLPTTLNFSVPGLTGKELLDVFDAASVRVSSGSACSSAKAAPSYVLEAMQLAEWRCSAAVRMSFGPAADDAFIDAACERIDRCGRALRICGLIPAESRGDSGAVACAAVEAGESAGAELSPSALRRLLVEQPDAILVDVREPWEYEVGKAAICGREVLSVPLSRLPSRLDGWLEGETRPLVFFCRSGARSLRAVQCVRRAGYQGAWHLAGGLALAGDLVEMS